MKKNVLIGLVIAVLVILGFVISRSKTAAPTMESIKPQEKTVQSQQTETQPQEKSVQKNANPTEQRNQQVASQPATKTTNNQTNEKKPMGLEIKTTKEGTGDRVVKSGDMIAVHYTGTLLDGTKFDSSVDRGTPFEFKIGQGMVIQGWDQGLLGMKVGEKRTLTIPSDLGYGARGAGAAIPPNATLVFETELISIK